MTARRDADGGYRVDQTAAGAFAYCMNCRWRDHTDDCPRTARAHSRAEDHTVVVERRRLTFLIPPARAARVIAEDEALHA